MRGVHSISQCPCQAAVLHAIILTRWFDARKGSTNYLPPNGNGLQNYFSNSLVPETNTPNLYGPMCKFFIC